MAVHTTSDSDPMRPINCPEGFGMGRNGGQADLGHYAASIFTQDLNVPIHGGGVVSLRDATGETGEHRSRTLRDVRLYPPIILASAFGIPDLPSSVHNNSPYKPA
jgi:hypothetical protein